MALENPERVVTKQDLKDFYDTIFPYLGGNAEAGFTPIGTIIAVMGNSAPTNYLACNGQVVNIADYPELANYFLEQFGSRNKFGGDGTTTFGIPDLRGEFLRGTGTNGHTGQGGGGTVGSHQNSTQIPVYALDSSILGIFDNGTYNYPKNPDAVIDRTNSRRNFSSSGTTSVSSIESTVTVRPTNTSVLYCIAIKDIYINPSLNYTQQEQAVGVWTNGKRLYQITGEASLAGSASAETDTNLFALPSGIESIASVEGIATDEEHPFATFACPCYIDSTHYCNFRVSKDKDYLKVKFRNMGNSSYPTDPIKFSVTVKYTKVTD